MKVPHRIIGLVCVVAAGSGPLWSAAFCRVIARTAIKDVFPHEPLPDFTQMWIAGIANGNIPILPIGLLVSALIVGLGLYFLLSRTLTPEARTSGLVFICCGGYSVAILALGNTLMGLVLPFVMHATER